MWQRSGPVGLLGGTGAGAPAGGFVEVGAGAGAPVGGAVAVDGTGLAGGDAVGVVAGPPQPAVASRRARPAAAVKVRPRAVPYVVGFILSSSLECMTFPGDRV